MNATQKGEDMTAQLIDGKLIAQQVRDEVAAKVAERTAAGKPKLDRVDHGRWLC